MSITGICVSFIVALLGLAYPLMLQVITRVEDKYKSSIILEQLLKEKSWRYYKIVLITSISLVLAYIIINYPLIAAETQLSTVLLHVIVILLIISTAILIASFMLTIDKIFIYDSISKLTKYLIKKDRKQGTEEDHQYINALSEILMGTVRDQNITIAKTISDYSYEVFQNYRDTHKDKSVEYPYPYYEFVYKTAEELVLAKERGMPFLEVRIFGGIWLFGQARGYTINDTTFKWTWGIILLAVKYGRADLLMHHWERADQYFSNNLSPYFNPEVTDEFVKARQQFLEFHYALGGLLLYREMHNTILRFFQFTRSQPPRYELLPETMDEIFQLYFKFRDPYDDYFPRFTSVYYFPELEGINSEYIIKNWICKYLALLFIRQYTIVPYLTTMRPLEQPNKPDNQQKRKMWIDNMGHFKSLVESTSQNYELLNSFRFNFITDEWYHEHGKPTPTEFFETLSNDLNELYDKTEIQQEIAEEKRARFNEYSSQKIISVMDLYNPISNKNVIDKEFKDMFIHGERAILDKNAFAPNQAADHTNYHSFLADSISNKFQSGISEVFFYHASKRYVVKRQFIQKALEQLNINHKEYCIIAFGINDIYLNNLLPDLDKVSKTYQRIQVHSYPQCNYTLVTESLFILNLNDLPNIENIDVNKDEIDKYELRLIEQDHKLFASVLDLNRHEDLRKEIEDKRPDEDLKKSVLAMIAFVTRIRFKKELKMVSIRVFSEFKERGLPIDPKDIEPLK